jgi:hypothetical protein
VIQDRCTRTFVGHLRRRHDPLPDQDALNLDLLT